MEKLNYRQILLIVGVLIVFELLAFGVKKLSAPSSETTPNIQFPLPLNDTTKVLLEGKWKYEDIFEISAGSFQVQTTYLTIKNNGDFIFTKTWKTILQQSEKDVGSGIEREYGYWRVGKWKIENGLLILEHLKPDPYISNLIVLFINEDEMHTKRQDENGKYKGYFERRIRIDETRKTILEQ